MVIRAEPLSCMVSLQCVMCVNMSTCSPLQDPMWKLSAAVAHGRIQEARSLLDQGADIEGTVEVRRVHV